MSSSARAILTAKVNSHPFDDRVLLLDVPCKIGRAHKEDQVSDFLKKKIKKYENYLTKKIAEIQQFDFTRNFAEFTLYKEKS